MTIERLRAAYHAAIHHDIVRIMAKGNHTYLNFADGSNSGSVQIAWGIAEQLNWVDFAEDRLAGQQTGARFEAATRDFVQQAFEQLAQVRPGEWICATESTGIAAFDQYEHLARIKHALDQNPDLKATLGGDYVVTPDVIVARWPLPDDKLPLIDANTPLAQHTPLRAANSEPPRPILHASISCKWTIRSDRAQNIRTEALNLIRNRKGRVPHIVVVTAEPLPTRLAAIALGTGDLDCVYHIALPELEAAVRAAENADQLDMLNTLVHGRRLRDVSDLPFDLAI